MVAPGFAKISLLTLALCGVASCKSRQQEDSESKALIGDRSILGAASVYPAEIIASPIMNMKERRDLGWKIVEKIIQPTKFKNPRIGSPDVEIPLWQSWYSADEFEYIFSDIFKYSKDPELQKLRDENPNAGGVVPFPPLLIDRVFVEYLTSVRSGFLPAWQKKSLEDHLKKFITEEDDRRIGIHEKVGLTNKGTSVFSPGLINHLFKNYQSIHQKCIKSFPSDLIKNDTAPINLENFSACFDAEFSTDSAVVKTTWQKIGKKSDGSSLKVGVFDTSATAIKKILGTSPSPDIAKQGSGEHLMIDALDPNPNDIFTATLKDDFGTVQYRLTGLHLMSKELRHWLWVSLWWAPNADKDFGADRPSSIAGVWKNYKMCVVTNFDESDPQPGSHYTSAKTKTLATALNAVNAASTPHSWCSNPFIETGVGNARTNCIGCHQHAGAQFESGLTFFDQCPDPRRGSESLSDCETRRLALRKLYPYHGRSKVRQNFPNDYLFSFDMPAPDLKSRIQTTIEDF